jgi:peptidoglycan/xylan/chitin deacetylase (PgdA/CDA1 family)
MMRQCMIRWVQGWCICTSLALTLYLQPQFLVDIFSYLNPNVIFSFDTSKAGNRCALTIDDAPSSSTNEILDVLKQYNARATFFVISNNVKGREAILDRIVAEGHEIGNHMTEDYPSLRYSTNDFERLFLESDKVLRRFQPNLRWFRPGSGLFSGRMLQTVQKHKHTLVLGSIYPHDPQIRSPLLNSMFIKLRARPGGVIILHDRPWTLSTLHMSLPELKSRGIELTTLSEMEAAVSAMRAGR